MLHDVRPHLATDERVRDVLHGRTLLEVRLVQTEPGEVLERDTSGTRRAEVEHTEKRLLSRIRTGEDDVSRHDLVGSLRLRS